MSLECFFRQPETIESNRVRWCTNHQLYNFIQFLCHELNLDPNSTATKESIACYLLERLRTDPTQRLINACWYCFLMSRAEVVVKKIILLLPTNILKFECLFMITVSRIGQPIDFFRGFQVDFGVYNSFFPRLQSWTYKKLKNLLVNNLREIYKIETLLRTDLGLVSRSSNIQTKKALIYSGYQEFLQQYLFIYKCFKEVKQAISLPINQWGEVQFSQVADRYNTLKLDSMEVLDSIEIKNLLNQIGGAIRNFLNCHIPNLLNDEYLTDTEDGMISILDIIPDPHEEDVFEHQILKEAVTDVVTHLFDREREIFDLYYVHKMNQTEIAKKLSVHQSTIHHCLKNIYQQIFSKILENMSELTESPNSQQLRSIHQYLKSYYSSLEDVNVGCVPNASITLCS